ncbi:MAG: sigma-54 dependent transcriptional regulator [Lentisphaeria bacterium]|nr:sigma-54 dependent transcriptional regulator [Lentisphaeria bacterium]
MFPVILVIDDERNSREGLRDAFADKYDILLADSASQGMNILKSRKVDIVLTDLRMPGMDGMAFTKEVSSWPDAPLIIMLTAYGSVQTAMSAMRAGAYDYLTKPIKLDDLEMMIDRGLEVLAERKAALKKSAASSAEGIIGTSPVMKALIEEAKQVADSRSTVLITGESGTGKELFAHAMHSWSPRANAPFVAVHCAALNENLLESELFGHEKGAFTGANERFIGRFERADHGTLFLDEIGEISLSTQVKLLRVLETRNLERVGGSTTIPVDVRLVAATNRDLKAMVKDGTFREDLFYRLNVVNLKLPPLREHPEDIRPLLDHFLTVTARDNGREITGITQDAAEALCSYAWPGNIRELRNCVERMVVMARGTLLTVTDIPKEIVDALVAPADNQSAEEQTATISADASPTTLDIRSTELATMKRALEQAKGNRTKAAEILGISRRTLQRRLQQYPELNDTPEN